MLLSVVTHLWLSWRVTPREYPDWPIILQGGSWAQLGKNCIWHSTWLCLNSYFSYTMEAVVPVDTIKDKLIAFTLEYQTLLEQAV